VREGEEVETPDSHALGWALAIPISQRAEARSWWTHDLSSDCILDNFILAFRVPTEIVIWISSSITELIGSASAMSLSFWRAPRPAYCKLQGLIE
jgi:hypothetical protein